MQSFSDLEGGGCVPDNPRAGSLKHFLMQSAEVIKANQWQGRVNDGIQGATTDDALGAHGPGTHRHDSFGDGVFLRAAAQ
ncbi:hypothetical protein PFL02_19650 [Pseudomonas fluorescens]|nr:hypothetical protein PFL02_19650 [Pseudomonas fluorescens]